MSADAKLPRVGCGAAILRDGRLLLVQRRRMPEAGHWGLPGGKVDPYETVPTAVTREIFEELGIRIVADRLLCVIDQIDRDRAEHWIAPVYRVEDFEGEPAIREPDALAALGWFALDDLPTPLTVATVQAVSALSRQT